MIRMSKRITKILQTIIRGYIVNQNFVINKAQDPQKETKQPKIIKRYGNRKLYDTEQSSYVVLKDIAKMIRNNEDVRIIDNETKDDITNSTFTQIIFVSEKNASCSTPLDILKNIIMKGDGSLSNFLAEMGLFKASLNMKNQSKLTSKASEDAARAKKLAGTTIQDRLNSAATSVSASHEILEGESLPQLPNGNKDLGTN